MAKRRQKKLEVRVEKKKKTDKADGHVISEKKTDEEIEKEKILLMRVGVACVMVVFFVAWIFNLKYQFKINSNNNNKSSFNWEQTKAELDKAMDQVKQGISEIKKIQAAKEQEASPNEPELTSEQINLLKIKLMNEAATGTMATSTIK
ncbi:MAG: hypothetical protein WCV70_02450 [Patescibacteria group bacterium]|jgi:hypothetical protein